MAGLRSLMKPVSVGMLLLALAACDTAEERAEAYYQSGLELLEEGDVERALVELRNVFDRNGEHQEARQLYASLVREQGNNVEAYGQFLLLVEQYPENYEGRLALAELAFVGNNLEEFRRHANALAELPDEVKTPAADAVAIGLRYQASILEEDNAARREAARDAEALYATVPGNDIVSRVQIDASLRDQDFAGALVVIDQVIADLNEPDEVFEQLRLRALSQMGNDDDIEEQLRRMVNLFPENTQLPPTLIRYYLANDRASDAEGFLAEISSPTDEDLGAYTSYIRFIAQTRGLDAARAQLDAGIAEAPEQVRLRALRAGFDFQQGNVDDAILALNEILETSEEGDDTNAIRVTLAQVLLTTGDEVGARQQIEQVLQADPSQAGALRMRAAWMIEADNTDGAIGALRTALDQDPDDAAAMTLMARAHTRAGNHELAQDFLALAVEASGNAPAETLRFSNGLVENENFRAAEDVLILSLRLNPGNEGLLRQLGRIYVLERDRPRAEQVIATLRRLDTESAISAANRLEATILSSSISDLSGTVAFLQDIAETSTGTEAAAARINIIRARMVAGEVDEALRYAREQLTETPEDDELRLAYASVLQANQSFEDAVVELRTLVERNPDSSTVRLRLIAALRGLGQGDEADTLLDEGLARTPEALDLLWAQASRFEINGDIESAIGVYEKMYALNSSLPVVANNLASLLSTARDDPESLSRAVAVSQRFRGTNVPAFQDTYGWVSFKNGELDVALEYLEPAARGLPEDALTQYHLGMAYLEAARTSDALEQFRLAVELAGELDTRPQIEEARAQVATLSASPDTQ